MDVAGSAVGIASLGIQICQGLLSYYDDWKSYNSDITSTYASIDDLSRTLVLLKASLDSEELDEERKDRVKACLQSCEDSLVKLSKKSQKLRTYGQPEGFRQKAWAELQKAWYPFRSSTLAKLREVVSDIRERLKLAVQVVQLDVSTNSQRILKQVAAETSDVAIRTANIEAQTGRLLAAQRSDQFQKITAWLSPPDPWTNHASARQRHEAQTGVWLLRSERYKRWKGGSGGLLWLYGKAGCGKTILCSTVIEDIRAYCATTPNSGHAEFYFSFSDNQKQSYGDLLRSLVVQLGWKEPGLSMLVQAYEKSNRSPLGMEDLEKILYASMKAFDEVFVLLDALDECPEAEEARQHVLEGLERLSQATPDLRIFVTSREVSDVRDSLERLGAGEISISTRSVDTDIQKWVAKQLLHDQKLERLDTATKALIEETFAQKADGMFRWAYCQLQELKKLKSTKPKYVQHALRNLPTTLDATYSRMLTSIEEVYRDEALALLRWLAYAKKPPSLAELAEVAIIDPDGAGFVDVANRGSLKDTIEILGDLITVQEANEDDDDNSREEAAEESENSGTEHSDSHGDVDHESRSSQRVGGYITIRLAHFSVKEYLESKRILQGTAGTFYLESAAGHRALAQSCLIYLMHYSGSEHKTSTEQDLVTFPLLDYAAESWFYHSPLQQSNEVSREIALLSSEEARQDWALVHPPDYLWRQFESRRSLESSVYFASMLGLEVVLNGLIAAGEDVNVQGGRYGNALQAAALHGYENIVKSLINAGADVNAPGSEYTNALHAASYEGNEKIVEMLLEGGADINARGGFYGNALQAASLNGNEKILKMLLQRGADVNAQGGIYRRALQAASATGNKKVVEMLLERGVEINAQGGELGNALQVASYMGNEEVVQVLLERGADINAQGGDYGTAIVAAASKGNLKVVEMLIDGRADVNLPDEFGNTPLMGATIRNNDKAVEMLIAGGADVNVSDMRGSALKLASELGHKRVVEILIAAGAEVNHPKYFDSPLASALREGHQRVAEILIENGAVKPSGSSSTGQESTSAASECREGSDSAM